MNTEGTRMPLNGVESGTFGDGMCCDSYDCFPL
jgi:hypothetical protein